MKRIFSLAATSLLGGALLSMGAIASHAQTAATNIFSLGLASNSANPNNLKVGDVLRVNAFLTSDGGTPVEGYQTVIFFDSNYFTRTGTSNSSVYTKNPNSPFDQSQPNGNAAVSNTTNTSQGFRRYFSGGEAFLNNNTQTFGTSDGKTPYLLGTFNLQVTTVPTAGTQIIFSDLAPAAPTANSQRNLLFSPDATTLFTPTFRNGVIKVAAVPEAGTMIGMSSMLGLGLLTIRRKVSRKA